MISFAQQKEVLHYFKNKDSLVGVKDKAGKIIVPAQFKIFGYLTTQDAGGRQDPKGAQGLILQKAQRPA